MLWLALAIAGSIAVALQLKLGEGRRRERLVMMAWNYLAGTAITAVALLLQHGTGRAVPMPGALTLILGAVTGVTYAWSLLLWIALLPTAGLGPATVLLRLSVVWPVLASLLWFHETPTTLQGAGIGLAFLATLLFMQAAGIRPGVSGARRWIGQAGLFLVAGTNSVLLKVFTAVGDTAESGPFLLLIFLFAGLFCWGVVWARRLPLHSVDVRLGLLFGVSNVASNAFLLWALQTVPGVIVFPLRDAAVVVSVAVLGMLLWKERYGRWGLAGILAAALAVVLISV